jgi:UDP-glucose 4-epimerase
MDLSGKRVLVTGAAGFVGSHLCERLAEENEVRVVDDLSNGDRAWVPDDVELVVGDLRDPDVAADVVTPDLDVVFHFAADRTVDTDDPRGQYERNGDLTLTVLERMRAVGVDNLAYTSSSTVYGEAPRPTPEDHAPLEPISVYGASKLSEESVISVYANSYGIQSWVYRFANIVGPRLQRGAVIPDFIHKLRTDPETLEILGDGRQEKSYLHVEDCVDAMNYVVEHADDDLNVYNLGTRSTTAVTTIADVVAEEMGVDPTYEFTGGERGWVGDVPRMALSIEQLASLGWEPTQTSDEAVRQATRELLAE